MGRSKQDYIKLKPPYVPTEFKTNELQEFIKCAQDPIYFMVNYVYIQHPTKGKIRFDAYDFQKDLVNTYNDFRNVIAMIPRQSGKCLQSDINISVRNKTTGAQYKLPIGLYYIWQKAIKDGTQPPDISRYAVK